MSTPSKYEGHTPGPWKAEPGPYITADGKDVLASWKHAGHVDIRLLADAPALLAENQKLREALQAMLDNGGTKHDEWMPLEVIRQAQAALKQEQKP